MSKSLRKISRINYGNFKVTTQKADLNKEKNELFIRHKKRFKGYRSQTLEEVLLDPYGHNIYDTYEVTVYDGDLLIAASFFDVGENSVTSIMGIFDPDYGKNSLGIFTMLCEIDYAKETGRTIYYPGYIVPGYPSFDYKLRLGNMEFFEPFNQEWLDYPLFDLKNLPIAKLKKSLSSLRIKFKSKEIECTTLHYPLFDKGDMNGELSFVQTPLILSLHVADNFHLIIDMEILKGTFRLAYCRAYSASPVESLIPFLQPFDKRRTCKDFLIISSIFGESVDEDEIVSMAEDFLECL